MDNLTNPLDNLAEESSEISNNLDFLFGGDGTPKGGDGKNNVNGRNNSSLTPDQLDISSLFNKAVDNIAPASTDVDESTVNNKNMDTTSEPDDDNLTGLNYEQIIKKLQSSKDKARAEAQKYKEELDKLLPIKETYNKIIEDPIVRKAFIAELEPELVKSKDPIEVVKEQLIAKYGPDFVPDKDEIGIPFTTSWQYMNDAQELLNKAKNSRENVTKTLSELKKEAEMRVKKQQEELDKFEQTMVNKFKWDKATFQQFQNWGSKLSLYELGTIFDYLMRNSQKRTSTPSLASIPGKTNITNDFKTELDKFFG